MPRVLEYSEGNNGPLRELSEEGAVSDGVFDHGTYEEDGLVTREALASPRRIGIPNALLYPAPPFDEPVTSAGERRAARQGEDAGRKAPGRVRQRRK